MQKENTKTKATFQSVSPVSTSTSWFEKIAAVSILTIVSLAVADFFRKPKALHLNADEIVQAVIRGIREESEREKAAYYPPAEEVSPETPPSVETPPIAETPPTPIHTPKKKSKQE